MSDRVYIGIDPDLEKSGVVVYSPGASKITGRTIDFFQLQELLTDMRGQHGSRLLVRIEGGWLNKKSNFHGRAGQSKIIGERIAKNVGENHATGKLIVKMCEHLGIQHEVVKPLGKVTPEFFEKISGLKTRNQEIIDAGMLVVGK